MTARTAEAHEQRKTEQRSRALAQADAQMVLAREAFSKAALRCLRGEQDAAQQVQAALAQVEAARAALREADDAA
jgi:hypothetical protein